jgi:hypothetical protein
MSAVQALCTVRYAENATARRQRNERVRELQQRIQNDKRSDLETLHSAAQRKEHAAQRKELAASSEETLRSCFATEEVLVFAARWFFTR